MKKRILSVLLVVAMLATMIVLPVYADGTATQNSGYTPTLDKCPCCGVAWEDITWKAYGGWEVTNADDAATKKITEVGHYYLTGDVVFNSTKTTLNLVQIEGTGTATESAKIVLDLNGYTINNKGTGRSVHITGDAVNCELYLLDAHSHNNETDTAGVIKSYALNQGGAAVNAGSGNTLHIYDITINGSTNTSYKNYGDGVSAGSNSTVNMYSGVINGTVAGTKNVGVVTMSGDGSTFNMYGGTINAANGGKAISARNDKTNNTINIQGGTVNGMVYLAAQTGYKILVSGNPVITNLNLTGVTTVNVAELNDKGELVAAELTDGASIGVTATAAETAFTNVGVAESAAYFHGATNNNTSRWYMEAYALGDGSLALRDVETEVCPHCDKEYAEITWTEYQYKNNVDLQEGGHYYLTSAKGGSNEVVMGKSGTAMDIIIDLNGVDITATNRVFSVASNCSLHLMDTAGGATVAGGRTAGTGSTIVMSSSTSALTLYSGTYTQKAGITNPNNGGVLYSNGNLTVTGTAVVAGGKTTASGGNIFATSGSELTISGNAQVYGGQAVAGSDIYCAGANLTIAETITGDIKLGFPNSMVSADRSLDYVTYGATAQNPALTLTADNVALDCDGAPILAKDGKLYVAEGTALAKQNGEDTEYTWFNTAAEAVAAYDAGGYDYIVVYGQDLALNGNEYVIDVNGCNVALTAEAATTAYCFDTANHEYVAFGNVTAGANVTVKSIDDSDAQITRASAAAYILLENEGVYSVHALDMDVSAIGLKTASNGMYYYANYKCDDTLKGEILSYGIEYALYDAEGNAAIAGTTTQAIEIENAGEGALVTNEDIAIGGMNGVIGSDINGYTDAECGKMKIMATPVVAVGDRIVSGATVGYSMFDCCQAVYDMIAACNAAGDTETAARYTELMNKLFTETWADMELDSWVFENKPETVA